MTRKDYELLARAFHASLERTKANKQLPYVPPSEKKAQCKGIMRAAWYVADYLEQDNPRFERRRFLTACGF